MKDSSMLASYQQYLLQADSMESSQTASSPAVAQPPSSRRSQLSRSRINRIGTVLQKKYRIESLLGEGGQGCVYRATHIQLQGTVAVKFLLSRWTQDKVLRARFEREARLLARLSHPNIVSAHDYGEDKGELFLVMDYVDGRALDLILMDNDQGLPVPRAIAISEQILDALAAAHACKVTHRDIKPSNVATKAPAWQSFPIAAPPRLCRRRGQRRDCALN